MSSNPLPDSPRSGTATPPARLNPVRTMLSNGVVVTIKETRKTPAVTINLAVNAGTVCDPDDAVGASFVLSRVIDRGTAHRSGDQLAEALESRGISLSIGVNRHQLSIVCTCLSADFEMVLGVLGEVIMEPAVPESELALRRGEVLTAIAQDDDSPYIKAVQELLALLYGAAHPYGRPAKGTSASVGALTRTHLLDLHRRSVGPSSLSAVIVGDLDPERAVAVSERVFGAWSRPTAAAVVIPPAPAATERRTRIVPMMNKSQADVAYGFVTIVRDDPSYYACSLMNNVLGQYAMGGRLGESIRERQGMAYYVSSALDANLAAGPLVIRAGVSPANVDRAVASIDEELTRIRREGVTPRELAESRQYLIGSMPRALETNAGIANFLQTAEFFGLGLDYDVRLPDYLSSVTEAEVHAAAHRLLDPARATVVIAGPYDAPV